MMNQSNSSSSSSAKVVCSNCKAKVSYPFTLHCLHKLCFKCSEKINKKEKFEELYSLTCPQCKVVTQTTDIYKLHQDNIQNISDLKENLLANMHNQQLNGNAGVIDLSLDSSNISKKKELGYYLNQEFQISDQGQLPQMLQNELIDEDFQFQNIPEEEDCQMNDFNFQIQQNQGNIIIDPRIQQQENNLKYRQFQQINQQNLELNEDIMQMNELQENHPNQLDDNQWIQNQFTNNQLQQQPNEDQINKLEKVPYEQIQGIQPITKQQKLYYEEDSLANLQDNLRQGINGGNSKGIAGGNDKNIRKNSVHNHPPSENIQNQNSTSSIQIRVGSGNSQGGLIINPHYYPQHARNNPNRFKSNSDKNNFLKREQELINTQQSSSDFQIFQSHPTQYNTNNNRFPSNPSIVQQEYPKNMHQYDKDKYSPKVIQKLEFSPSSHHQQMIDQYQNQQMQGFVSNMNSEGLILPNEQEILMIDELAAKQMIDMNDAQYNLAQNQIEDGVDLEEQKSSSFRGYNEDDIYNNQYSREGNSINYNIENGQQQQQQLIQIDPSTGVTLGGGNINPDKPLVCKEHNDYVQLYCQDDKSLLCVNCLYQNDKHKRHRVAPLKRSIDMIKKENQQFKLEAKEKLILIENSLKICNSNKSILRDGYSYLAESVSKEFSEIQKVLVEQERKVQIQIQQIFEERLKEYDQMLNDLSYLKSCIREYRDCDKNANPNLTVYVFSIYSMIRNTLRNIDFSFKQIHKNDVNICDFKNNKSTIISEIQSFGKIINDLNIRDPNTLIGNPNSQQHYHSSHASSSQKQQSANSHSNSKSNLDSYKKGNNHYAFQQGSLTNSASKTHVQQAQQGVPVQQFLAVPSNQQIQNLNQAQSTIGQKQLPQNQKSSTTSLETNAHKIQPTRSQQNLLPDQTIIHGNHSFHYSPFADSIQQSQQNKNPKSRNQTPSPYKHNQKVVSYQSIPKEVSCNIQYHRDFLDAQFDYNKKQTPRQISYHNSIQNQQQQQQVLNPQQQQNFHQQSSGQHHQQQVQQQQQSITNPHSSSYAKLIVSRSTKFSNKKQQQECLKEIQKCQTPPQDRRMNELVKNIQNISYYTLLEEKYNKRSKSSQKKPTFTQNQMMQNK